MARRSQRPRITVEGFLQQRRRRRWTWTIVALVVAGLLAVADRQGWLLLQGSDWTRYHNKTAFVSEIVDGDTLHVAIPDGRDPTTRVRLWGIDCPETAKPWNNTPAEPYANEATVFAWQHSLGRSVTLRLQAHRIRDRHGRLLAYVVLPDGSVLNEHLVAAGLARADRRFPHDDMERYENLETQAKRKRLGLWQGAPGESGAGQP